MIQILVTILTILAAILTILAGVYTVYFGIQKTGTKVKATFSIVAEKSYETRISNVVLQNKKDLPVCIYKVLAIFDDKTYLELKKFDNPLVLKPYEALTVITDPYSRLRLGNDIHEPSFFSSDIKIALQLLDEVYVCESQKYKESSLKELKQIAKSTSRFNGIVYNEHVKYILVYEINGLNKTAFFHPSGLISQEWNLGYNAIGIKNRELNDDDISLFLQQNYSEIIKAYEIHLVDKNSLKTTFVKRHIPS